ncbi:MAG: hypothetical protein L0226_07530 [Acidobacteria bacterium]|nr:hypothetical protein [Acidobacteriota bacterium]
MRFKKCGLGVCVFFLICVANANDGAGGVPASTQAKPDQPKPPEIERITAEELKTKIAGKIPVAIIDVRSTNAFIGSDNKIKGAIRVKARRLQSRLAFPPLKDIPRDREVVTYCACPNDETSVRAARVLLAAGFKRVRALKGGWQAWLKVNGQVEQRM